MQIRVIAKTRSKRPAIAKLNESVYEVCVNAPPIEGRANKEIIDSLAKYFGLHRNQVQIISGHNSANKTIELSDEF